MTLFNAIIQGILLGGLYALFASGLSLMFGVMRTVNLAHGDFAVLAAFGALLAVEHLHLSAIWSLVLVLPLMAVLGYVLQRLVLQRTVGAGPLAALLVTFGLSIIIQNGLQEWFSADQRRLHLGSLETGGFTITKQLAIGYYPLLVFGMAVLLLVALWLFLGRTRLGRMMRATSDDPEVARLMGVDSRHIYGIATAIAFGSVALAGVFNGISTSFAPTSGSILLIFAFEAVIIGGLGNLWGTLVGGVILGVAQNVGAWISPAQQVLAGHIVFLVILAVRPQGLLGRKVATA